MSAVVSRVNECRVKKNDIIYTPKPVALKMIEMCGITPDMKVLDPCLGGGVFYDNLPPCDKHWCEIEKDKDFFSETERYDLIIGNPPFSLWSKWLEHTIKLTDKFCYIFGGLNLTTPRLLKLQSAGYGITKMCVLTVDYWFGNAFIVVFEKNKPSFVDVIPPVYCDVCNSRCNRGSPGYSYNECSPKPEKKPRKKNDAKIEA